MSPATPNRPTPGMAASRAGVDLKLVSDILIQLNILRKNTKIYPDGHPALRTSVGRAARLLQAFHAQYEILAFTVARNTLQIGKQQLPPSNPIVAEYAAHLRDQSIHAMSLKRGITDEGLIRVSRLLSGDPKALPPEMSLAEAIAQASGGLAEVRLLDWSASEFADVPEIDLSNRAAAGSSESSWDAFIRRLVQRGDEALLGGEQGLALSEVGTEKLAALADKLEAAQDRLADHETLADYAKDGTEEDTPRARLLRLASTLEPRLRTELTRPSRQFATRSLKTAEALLNEKDVLLVLRVLEKVNAEGPPVDSRVVALVHALAGTARSAPGWPVTLERPSQEREFSEYVHALLSVRGFPAPPATDRPMEALRKLEEDLRIRTGSAATGSAILANLRPDPGRPHRQPGDGRQLGHRPDRLARPQRDRGPDRRRQFRTQRTLSTGQDPVVESGGPPPPCRRHPELRTGQGRIPVGHPPDDGADPGATDRGGLCRRDARDSAIGPPAPDRGPERADDAPHPPPA
jgi:hypothetical protein